MPRSLLYVLDGESLRTSALAQALDLDGWELEWANSGVQERLAKGVLPDLILVDPASLTEGGLELLASLRRRKPGLAVAAAGEAGEWEDRLLRAGVERACLHRISRALPASSWPASLRSCLRGFGARSQPFTSEDLFGDILADIEGPLEPEEAPAGTLGADPLEALPALDPAVPGPPAAGAPAPVPAVQPPAPLPEIPSAPVPGAEAPAPLPAARVPAPAPPPAYVPSVPPGEMPLITAEGAPALSALFDRIMDEPLPEGAAPSGEATRDYTLSGFAGIQDPFENHEETRGGVVRPPLAVPPAPAAAPLPAAEAPQPRPLVLPPPAPQPEEGLEEFGNYYLLEKIAVGGMAELFKARQRGVHNFEKIVAIKRILPHLSDNDEFVRMFIDEAKLAAQLTHPNIAQIFDLGKAGGFYYIAMEFVDGKDLRSLLRKVREYHLPVPEAVAAAVTMKVANALDYAHRERGINDRELKLVHRDISPQNILISFDGGVKLVDFGIAKAATKSTQTMAGALKGKLLYMSPEQALGEAVDGRSDLYSLGLVLFELLTGERCFQADSELGVLEKVRLGKVLDVREVNPAVSADMAAILDKALQKDLPRRYASARFLERDLKTLLVKHRNEPTEHEIAEYVHTLLKGTREEVTELLAVHFPPPVSEPLPEAPEAPPASASPAPGMGPRIPLEVPLPEALEEPVRRKWLLPALGILGALLAIGVGIRLLMH